MYRITVTHKRQSRKMNCWYACIQMILSAKFRKDNGFNQKVKPQGPATMAAYNVSDTTGEYPDDASIMQENNLVAHRVPDFTDPAKVKLFLQLKGPVILYGRYGGIAVPIINKSFKPDTEHCVVLAGAQKTPSKLWIHDPVLWDGKWMSPTDVANLDFGNSAVGVQNW